MTIVPYALRRPRRVHNTTIPAGTIAYAIKRGALYFAWSYTDLAFAEKMDSKIDYPHAATDIQANWRASPHDTTVSARTTEE